MKSELRYWGIASAIISFSLLLGCSSTDSNGAPRPKRANTFDGVVRPPKDQIDIFVGDQVPAKKYKVIKILSEKSGVGAEAKLADSFVKKAKSMGADGIIINPSKSGGFDVGPFGGKSLSSYSALVIVYE